MTDQFPAFALTVAGAFQDIVKDPAAVFVADIDGDELEQEAVIGVMRALTGPDPANPPEAPPNDGKAGPAAQAKHKEPVVLPPGGLDAADRAALKAYAIEHGVPGITTSSRLGDKALRDAIRAHESAPAPAEYGPVEVISIAEEAANGFETAAEYAARKQLTLPGVVVAVLPADAELRAALDSINRIGDLLRRVLFRDADTAGA